MNVSNIISSLVEANKGRIVSGGRFNNKRDSNFDRVEEAKLFPNKKNSSIYEPRSHTTRSEDKSIEIRDKEKII
jgi:hypothetical protein